MPASTVRADYDQLKQAASAFGQNSSSCQQTLRQLKSNLDTLQGGDWIGQGANAFYKEMGDSVLPTLQRLINALSTAQNSLTKISAIMKDAEDQAANVLKGPGGSSGPIGTSFGPAAGAGRGATLGGGAGAGPMGGASQFAGLTNDAGSKDPVKFSQMAGKIAHDDESPKMTGNTVGSPQLVGVKTGAGNPIGGATADVKTILWNQAAEEIPKESSSTAANVKTISWNQAADENPKESSSLSGNNSSEWIKASGAATPKVDSSPAGPIPMPYPNTGPKIADINVTKATDSASPKLFQQAMADGASLQKDLGGAGLGSPTTGNTSGGPAGIHVTRVTDSASPNLFNQALGGGAQNTVGGQANQGANTIGGAAAQDDWEATGGAAGGANTIGGTAAQDDWEATGGAVGGANTIGGTAAQDDWEAAGG